MLSKKIPFKKFLAFMAEKAPETMEMILKNILKKIPKSTPGDHDGKGRKRASDETAREEARETKRAKLERIRMFAREAVPNEESERVSKKALVVHSPLQTSSIDVPFPNLGMKTKNGAETRYSEVVSGSERMGYS